MKVLIKNLVLLSIFSSVQISSINSQDCQASSAYIELDGNGVTAGLRVAGDLWWNGNSAKYTAPEVEPGLLSVSPIFSGGLWLASKDVPGNIRVAAAHYPGLNSVDFWPGPLDENGLTESDICSNWDRFFKVNRSDVEAHIADFAADGDIDTKLPSVYEWPGQDSPSFNEFAGFELPLGQDLAPFVDLDDDGIYEPDAGEYPQIKGTQAIWWVFNDSGNTHTQTGTDPLGVEVQVLAYASESNIKSVDLATMYDYKIINRGGETHRDFRLGLWVDPDLGCHFDDMLGWDASRNMAYAYNHDDVDGNQGSSCTGGVNTYKENIPMVGFSLISSNIVESTGDGMILMNNPTASDEPSGSFDPQNAFEYYNFLNNLWNDQLPITSGGVGYNIDGVDTVSHIFPGAPDDSLAWSMCSEGLEGRDVRFVMTNGIPTFQSQQSIELTYAVVFVEDVPHPCPSLEPLRGAYDEVVEYYGLETATKDYTSNKISTQVIPNPTNGSFLLQFTTPINGEVLIINSMGKRIRRVVTDKSVSNIELNISNESAGLYYVVARDFETGIIVTNPVVKVE